MKARAPKPLEHQIVKATLDLLRLRHPMIVWIRVEPSGAMSKGTFRQRRNVDAGSYGAPDILGIWGGPTICLEGKRPGAKQRDSQTDFEARARKAGALYAIFTSPEEACAWMLGAPRMWITSFLKGKQNDRAI